MAEVAISGTTGVVLWTGPLSVREKAVGLLNSGTKDSGTLKIQASWKVSPNVATAADWMTIEGMEDLALGTVYVIGGRILRATAVMAKASGAAASLTVLHD